MLLHKQYAIEHSPLYKLSNKRKLCSLLNTEFRVLSKLLEGCNYSIYEKKNPKSSKIRTIYAPKPIIKTIQKKLQIFLSRLLLPTYVFSGKKKTCYVDNAKFHLEAKYLITIDISNFYTSCRKEYVFRFFKYDLKIDEDVAWLLTSIVTYDKFLPTGSPSSQIIAFLAYKPTFDRIDRLAKNNDAKFSLFVDDMTFSSAKPFPKNFAFLVAQELKKVGLEINPKKIHRYSLRDHKIVTGCVITPNNQLAVRNRQRKRIIEEWCAIQNKEKYSAAIKSLLGRIQAMKQIDETIFHEKYRYLSGINKQLD